MDLPRNPDPEDASQWGWHGRNKGKERLNGCDNEASWGEPDRSVLRLNRRSPPPLPLQVFGDGWGRWLADASTAAACPVDYVAATLLPSASALIGNARWPQVTPAWTEPPHLWCCSVGDSGDGKSPGADSMTRWVLPEIERRMCADFPDKLREWQAEAEARAAKQETWKQEVRKAQKGGYPPPLPPEGLDEAELLAPVLRSSDVTVERTATLLSNAAPKGLLIVRDELVGWLRGMNAYHDAGRPFWIEAYGGRPYRVDRQKLKRPIEIPHLVVAAMGGTQPDKLAEMFNDTDDGLMSRLCWFWPEPVPFRLGREAPNASQAIEALDRLRLLDMALTEHGLQPIYVPLANDALQDMEAFGCTMQDRKSDAPGLMRSAIGKFRGTALRVSLVLEYLWWCARPGYDAPPVCISRSAFQAAVILVGDYLMPMAERVYGDAGLPVAERNATSIARWVVKTRSPEVHIRHLQREVRLPGLRTAEAIREACNLLIEADWLRPPRLGIGPDRKVVYRVNRNLWKGEP